MKKVMIKILVAVICLLSLCAAPAFCQEAQGTTQGTTQGTKPDTWKTIESSNFTVYYRPEVNLEAVERSLRRRTTYFGRGTLAEDATAEKRVAYWFELLLNRAKEILGMYWKAPKISVKIFKDRDELSGEYVKIFGDRQDYKSFYVYKYNTIYTSGEDISDSVVSHEIAHAIIDHYFAVVPPKQVSEILASYVDMHLED